MRLGVSVLPGAAVAALGLFLAGRLLAWQQIAGSLFSSATEGTPPTRHGNLQPTHKQGSFFTPANNPSAETSVAVVFPRYLLQGGLQQLLALLGLQ